MLKKIQLLAILSFLILFIGVASVSASTTQPAIKIGDWEVVVLNEVISEGDTSILLNASPADVKTYIPTGKYPTSVNAFLLRSADKNILVDAGLGLKLIDNLAALNVKPDDIDAILLTHMHFDHIDGLLKDGKAVFPKAKLYVAAKEKDFWLSEPDFTKVPEAMVEVMKSGFKKSRLTLEVYRDRLNIFEPNDLENLKTDLLPGLKAIAAYGHTPGHTVFLAESKGEQLLFWGDLTHASAIQNPRPEVAVVYDTDPAEAVKARLATFKLVAEKDLPVAGSHIPAPSMGWLKTDSNNPGSYTFKYLPKPEAK